MKLTMCLGRVTSIDARSSADGAQRSPLQSSTRPPGHTPLAGRRAGGERPVCASAALGPRVALPVEARLTDQGLAATVPGHSQTAVIPGEMLLAGYLLDRALDGRKVEGEDFDRLRRANDSVREVRALLPFGRGNVVEDIAAGQEESSTRVYGARKLRGQLPDGPLGFTSEAAAIWAGAGNCFEHAVLAACVHAGRLNTVSGEMVTLLCNIRLDHAWAESVIPRPWKPSNLFRPDRRAIVLDAWKDGPAVFGPDSTRKRTHWIDALPLTRRREPDLSLKTAKVVARRTAVKDFHDPRELEPHTWPKKFLGVGMLWNAETVVDQAFLNRVSAKPVSVMDVLETVRKSNPDLRAEGFLPAMPAEIRKEILAAGIARELMAAPAPLTDTPKGRGRVCAAAAQAPSIVDAAKDLRQITSRGGTR